jgi:hypothetical protein
MSEQTQIHSVRRRSDNKIFTLGDIVIEQKEPSLILYFIVEDDMTMVRIHHMNTLGSSTCLIDNIDLL